MPAVFLVGAVVGAGSALYLSDGVKAASRYAIAGGAVFLAGKMLKVW